MNPAERYAALKLLEAGLKDALATAAEAADDYRREVRAKSLETDYGTVTVARRKPAVVILDDRALIAWCDDELPHLVQRSITLEGRAWLTGKRFVIDGSDVIDPTTGEAMPFMGIKDGTEYLTFRPTPEARATAVGAVSTRLLDALTAELQLPAPESVTP